MDYALTETMLALGAVPIAMPQTGGWSRWVVEPPLPASVVDVGSSQEVDLELLASLKPDLILTSAYLADLEPTLSRIAPCERLSVFEAGRHAPLEQAVEVTRRLGRLLGDEGRAERYLAETEMAFAALRARSTGSPGPLLMVNVIDARHVRAYGTASLWGNVLDRIGQTNAWRRQTSFWGFSTVGVEELAEVPDDTILVTFRPVPSEALGTLDRSPLWRNLPFVRKGRSITLDPALVFGGVPSARRFAGLLDHALARMAIQ